MAVPRIWRTASFTCVIPCVYASARLPPWVFTGNRPAERRLPSATYGPPSPLAQKPKSSSAHDHHAVKWSYTIAASMSVDVDARAARYSSLGDGRCPADAKSSSGML